MKRFNSIIAIIGLEIVAIIVAFVSCKKEKQEQKSNNVEQSVQNSDNMDEYLMSFKKKLLSAQKGEETISLEQAQRDLGNLLNFDFGDANYATTIFHYDTLFTNLNLTIEGQVDLSQLASIYLDLQNQVKEAYRLVDLPEKSVYMISCSFEDYTKDNENQVTVVLTTRAYDEITSDPDDWRAGSLAGKCNGSLVGFWGGPEQLESMLRANLGGWSCLNGGRVYFTEEDTCWIEANEPAMIDSNAPRGHRLFYIHDPNGQIYLQYTCLSDSEFMYYYDQARYLYSTCRNYFHPASFPINHVVTNYRIEYKESSWGYSKTAWWKIYLNHAKVNCTGSQPISD